MRNTWAILKKEFAGYVTSPIAYAVCVIFLVLSSLWFYVYFGRFAQYSSDAISRRQDPYNMGGAQEAINVTEHLMRDIFSVIYFFLLLIIPLLTMRLLSEEKRLGTSELLLTFPIRDWEVVLGKFLACSAVVIMMVAPTWIYPLLLYHYQAPPEMPVLLSAYFGVILGAIGFVALGMFVSSMTENQIVAASVTIGLSILFWVVGAIAENATEGLSRMVLMHISLFENADSFFRGIIQTKNVLYSLCFTLFFLFLTLCSLGSARWRS